MNKYQAGDYSKRHLAEVKEICGLRKLMDMRCSGCVFEGLKDCPEVRKTAPADTRVMGNSGKPPI
jgi:hypothetical protein